jgi:hypothetical protein
MDEVTVSNEYVGCGTLCRGLISSSLHLHEEFSERDQTDHDGSDQGMVAFHIFFHMLIYH